MLGSEIELRILEVFNGVEGWGKSQQHSILLAPFDLSPLATKDAHLATSQSLPQRQVVQERDVQATLEWTRTRWSTVHSTWSVGEVHRQLNHPVGMTICIAAKSKRFAALLEGNCVWDSPELPATSDIARCTHCQKEMMKHFGLECTCRAPWSPIHQHAPQTHLACIVSSTTRSSSEGAWKTMFTIRSRSMGRFFAGEEVPECFCSSQLCGQSCQISNKLDPLLWLFL